MMAAALIAGDWLHIEGRVAGVSKVNVAIIDGSNTRRDSAGGIFALDEIGALIGVPGAGGGHDGAAGKLCLEGPGRGSRGAPAGHSVTEGQGRDRHQLAAMSMTPATKAMPSRWTTAMSITRTEVA